MSERRGTVKLCSHSAPTSNFFGPEPNCRKHVLRAFTRTNGWAQADSVSRTSAVWPQQRRGVIVVGEENPNDDGEVEEWGGGKGK